MRHRTTRPAQLARERLAADLVSGEQLSVVVTLPRLKVPHNRFVVAKLGVIRVPVRLVIVVQRRALVVIVITTCLRPVAQPRGPADGSPIPVKRSRSYPTACVHPSGHIRPAHPGKSSAPPGSVAASDRYWITISQSVLAFGPQACCGVHSICAATAGSASVWFLSTPN
jgi:hypothetical protein